MNYQIFLKLMYLLDNFESIDSYELKLSTNRQETKYFLNIYKNNKYFNNEELIISLKEYFEDLPIVLSIV